MKIVVRQEHIDKGIRGSGSCCPLALACKEALKRDDIEVGRSHVKVGDGWFHLPLLAVSFVANFDSRHPNVAPFEFDSDSERLNEWRSAYAI